MRTSTKLNFTFQIAAAVAEVCLSSFLLILVPDSSSCNQAVDLAAVSAFAKAFLDCV